MSWRYKTVQIGKLVDTVKKWDPHKCESNQFLTYIDIASVNRETKTIDQVSNIHAYEAPSRARQLIKKEDILVSTVRPNLNAVAKVTNTYNSATASTGFCVLRPKPEKLDSRFLYYWVRTTYFVDDMIRQSTGASYPAVSDAIIKKYFIPLPPIAEQRRIAKILDKADEIRRKRQQAIKLTEELGRSLFLDMFGDPVTNPKSWEVKKINELTIKTKKINPREMYKNKYFTYIDISSIDRLEKIVISPQSVFFDNAPSRARQLVQSKDVLVSTVRPNLNSVAYLDDRFNRAVASTGFCILRTKSDKLNPCYLFNWVKTSYFVDEMTKQSTGASYPAVNDLIVKSSTILLPPIEIQNQFESLYLSLQKHSKKQKQYLQESENLFNSLLQRAFKGEL